MKLKKAIVKRFNDHPINFFKDGGGELWVTADQIGQALGYAEPRKGVMKIYERHQKHLEAFSTVVNLGTVGGKRSSKDGKRRDVRIFNEIAVNFIGFKSNTEKSIEFALWAAQIIADYRKGFILDIRKLPSVTFMNTAQRKLGKIRANIIISRLFGIGIPPIELVRDSLLYLGTGMSVIKKKFGYQNYGYHEMLMDINTGEFKDKEGLAKLCGLSVSDIWGNN